MTDSQSPQGLHAEDWAGEMGERWLRHLDRFEGMIAPVGRALIDQAQYGPGERVLDVGCGAGGTSLQIAQRVAPRGSVLGIDISPVLVEAAERRARSAAATNLAFRCVDASQFRPEEPFDRVFSRFGVMFFPDAPGAFAHLRRALHPAGRANFSVWAPLRQNAWIARSMQILQRHVELPAPIPRSPGPFALDDPGYVRELLEGAGFTSIRIDTWEGQQLVGGPGATPTTATEFLFDAMSIGRQLQECGEAVRARVRAELIELFEQHRSPEGIRMSATAYLVTALAGA